MSKVIIVLIAAITILALVAGCSPATPNASVPQTATGNAYPAAAGNPTVASNPTGSSGYPAPSDSTPAAPAPTDSNSSTPATNGSYPAPGTFGNGLQVTASDGTTKAVTMADLNDLPKVTVGSDSGPKLIDVLQFASIFDFSTVTITGSNGSKDLTTAQVNDQVILSLANNSVTLVIDGAASDQAIKNITTIKVN